MPKCTICKKQITYLVYRGSHSVISDFDKNGNYSGEETVGFNDVFFSCPECEMTLFEEDEEAAIKFLNGKE